MIECCSQIVDISTCICLVDTTSLSITKLLWCRISSSTESCCISIVLDIVGLSCTKVDKLYSAIRLKHNVRWLHITIYNRRIHRMKIFKSRSKLKTPLYNLILREASNFLQFISEVLTFYEVHYYTDS